MSTNDWLRMTVEEQLRKEILQKTKEFAELVKDDYENESDREILDAWIDDMVSQIIETLKSAGYGSSWKK